MGCTQQMLPCCWVREAASCKCSVPALTQQRFPLATPPIPDFAAPCPERSAGPCGGLERAVGGGGGFSLCLYGSVCLLMSLNIKEEAVFFLPDLLFVSFVPTPLWLLFSQGSSMSLAGQCLPLSEGMEGILLLRVNVGEFLASLHMRGAP